MQVKFDIHNETKYDYYYVESHKAIIVFKNGTFAYIIKAVIRKNGVKLFCNCPGAIYHKKCHHEAKARAFNFNKVVKAKTFTDKVNEEFITGWLEDRSAIKTKA